jgi:hypothetical protein
MNFYEMTEQMQQTKQISYTAIVIDQADRTKLLERFKHIIPSAWEVIAHHMTINLGAANKGPAADMVGQSVRLTVRSFAGDDKVMAIGIETNVPSGNAIKHITLAVNRQNGGKPAQSNQLSQWQVVQPMELRGIVQEISR